MNSRIFSCVVLVLVLAGLFCVSITDGIDADDQNPAPDVTDTGTRTYKFIWTGEGARTIHWDFGDGTTAEGSPVTHTYAHDGKYTYSVYGENEVGRSETISGNITVKLEADEPTYKLSASTDKAGSEVEYGYKVGTQYEWSNGSVEAVAGHNVALKANLSTGLTFARWIDSEGNTISTDNPYYFTMPAHSVNYKAVIEGESSTPTDPDAKYNVYELEFNSLGGSVNSTYRKEILRSEDTGIVYFETRSVIAEKDGYKFIGWSTANGGLDDVSDEFPFIQKNAESVKEDPNDSNRTIYHMTIYAVWEKDSSGPLDFLFDEIIPGVTILAILLIIIVIIALVVVAILALRPKKKKRGGRR